MTMTMAIEQVIGGSSSGRFTAASRGLAFLPSATSRQRRGLERRAIITSTAMTRSAQRNRHIDNLCQRLSSSSYRYFSASQQRPESSASSPSASSSPRILTRLASSSSSTTSSTGLEWETFEFSSAPKWDSRFDEDLSNDDDGSSTSSNTPKISIPNPVSNSTMLYQKVSDEEWNQIVKEERLKDEELSRRLERQNAALDAMDPVLIQRAVQVLSRVVQPNRYQRISSILQQRTRHVRFLFENPGNPSNVWACLRTLDSFGIQHVGIVMDPTYYEQGGGKAAIVQKRGMRTAMGSAQWMTLHHYLTITQAIEHIRQSGFSMVASDLREGAHDIRTLPWNELSLPNHGTTPPTVTSDSTPTSSADSSPPPICIVMGNEGKGISEEMRQECDATFYLPMSGFAESFNLSVATAITCAYLSAASAQGGPHHAPLLRPGDLHPHEYNCLLLKGLQFSFAKKRTAQALLRNEGIVLPPEMNWI